MKIAVIGAGGVGGYFGGKLASGGADVVFLVRGRTLEALRTNGLRVDSIAGNFEVANVNATDDPSSVGKVDAVLLATKAWQIAEACETARPMIGDDTMVIPLENGMEAPETIARILGRDHAMGGLCAIVSFIVEPGHIRHVGAEPFIMFGELDNRSTPRAEALRDALVRAGVSAEIPTDIHRSMWTKFLFITPLSGMGAITRVPIGMWRAMPETRAIAEAALRELVAIAAAQGASLGDDAVPLTLSRYDAMPAEATSSLQRDVMDGKPSELDAQLGAAVRMGAVHGIPTPACTFLYHALLPQERIARGEVG
jgi:2-dehydropantoate 2-reductase